MSSIETIADDDEPATLGLGCAPSASYELAFEFAARNMPGRMGDPVAPLAHEFAAWAEDAWTSGHVDAAFERWMIDVKAPVRPDLLAVGDTCPGCSEAVSASHPGSWIVGRCAVARVQVDGYTRLCWDAQTTDAVRCTSCGHTFGDEPVDVAGAVRAALPLGEETIVRAEADTEVGVVVLTMSDGSAWRLVPEVQA